MKAYYKSTTDCRRHLLFNTMERYDPVIHSNLPPEVCCDVCKLSKQ